MTEGCGGWRLNLSTKPYDTPVNYEIWQYFTMQKNTFQKIYFFTVFTTKKRTPPLKHKGKDYALKSDVKAIFLCKTRFQPHIPQMFLPF